MIRFALVLALLPGLAEAACRQALSMGLDVSSSVDDREYRLQLEGVIAALNSDTVREILFIRPEAPIRLHVFEWSGPVNHREIVPWTEVRSPADLAQITRHLRAHERGVAAPTTAIGSAILQGFAYLEPHVDCWQRTLDLSGDGATNTGPVPESIPDSLRPPGVTVNGLVVGAGDARSGDATFVDIKELSRYYETNVIRGPGAFVEVALGYEAYAAAMERKLVRELASMAVGELE
jgi:hypothetical protein